MSYIGQAARAGFWGFSSRIGPRVSFHSHSWGFDAPTLEESEVNGYPKPWPIALRSQVWAEGTARRTPILSGDDPLGTSIAHSRPQEILGVGIALERVMLWRTRLLGKQSLDFSYRSTTRAGP